MKDEYLTIAEFAKQAGVTKQAIYKRLNNDLSTFSTVVDGQKCINSKALSLFGVQPVEKDASTTIIDLVAHLQKQHDTLSHLVDVLEGELATKDEQIKSLSQSLDQEQQLHAMIQRTHAHALLNGSRQDPAPSPIDQDEIDAAYRKGKADAQEQMVRIAKALSRNYPDAADFLIAEFDK